MIDDALSWVAVAKIVVIMLGASMAWYGKDKR